MNIRYSAIALAVMGFSASAQESPKFKQLLAMDLGEMLKVEVATGTAKQLSEAPAVVSVITADDIKAMGARTLTEALERVPGLHASLSDNRANTLYSIRGIRTSTTPQVLILFDGVNISEATLFSSNFSFRYPVNFIERIEIIRGPGSAVYGADAFSGVINVITKSPSNANSAEVGGSLGSFDYIETWFNANYTSGDFRLNMSVTHEETGNDDDRVTPFGIMARERELNNIHINMEYGNYSFKNWYHRNDQRMGIGAGVYGNDMDRDETEMFKTQLNWNGELTDEIDGSADVSYLSSRYDARFNQIFPPGVFPVGDDGNLFTGLIPVNFPDGIYGQPEGTTNKLSLNAALIYSGVENHRIRVGFGFEGSKLTDVRELKNFGPGVTDTANLPEDPDGPDGPLLPTSGLDNLVDLTGTDFIYVQPYDRDVKYISVQDEWKFADKWELTAGVRYDDYSDFGSTTNPRLALVWNSRETLTTKFLYGTAFRAPKVAELAFINNPTTVGNPNLQPEEIETIEIAFDYRPNKNFTGLLNIFSYQSTDLIELVAGEYQNIGEQDGHGVEVEANWQATPNLRINSNFSFLDSELPLSAQDKAQVPGNMVFLDVQYQIAADWLFTTQNYWINNRKRQFGDTREKIDDYLKTDITVLWQSDANINVRFGVKNLFDDDIREPTPNSPLFGAGLGFPDDIPLESRSIFGTVTVEF